MRIEEEIFKCFHFVRFFYKSVGVKNINASNLVGCYIIHKGNIVKLKPSQLFLGPDFLKDKYSLLGHSITESPHVGFFEALMNGKSIAETDYIRRFLDGTLDWRSASVMPKDKLIFKKKFEQSLSEIKTGNYSPAVVYLQGGKYYIYDGKHRAALCAMLGKEVRCVVVGSEIVHANVWNYMYEMINGNEEYRRHTDFHKEFVTEYEHKCRE